LWSGNDFVSDQHAAAAAGVRYGRDAPAFEDAGDGSNVLSASCYVKDAQYGDQRGFPMQQGEANLLFVRNESD
jgi:hypothetical protein